jgi:hypothetical protein
MGERGEHTGFWCGKAGERNDLEVLDISRKIILKWSFRKWDGRAWTEQAAATLNRS